MVPSNFSPSSLISVDIKSIEKYLLTILAIFLLILYPLSVNGQEGGYIVKIEVRGINLPPGCQSNVAIECGEELIENLYLSYFDKSNETGYFEIPKDADLTITMETLRQNITPELGYKEYLFEVSEWGTTFTLRVRISVYDFPDIISVWLNGNFVIYTDTAKNLPPESTLLLNYRITGMDWQQSTSISNAMWQIISYTELFGSLDSCDNTFEFKYSIRLESSGGEYFGTTLTRIFSPLLGAVTINNVSRKACPPYLTINATVDPSIASYPSRYSFFLLDYLYVPYIFDRKTFNGNTLTLEVTSATENSIITGSDYILHVEDNYSNFCPRELLIAIGAPVAPLNIIDASAISKIKVGGIDYHITKNGMANGEATVTLASTNNLNRLEIKKSNWSDFQNYGYVTNGNSLTLSGLAAGSYKVRCLDNDGCYSNEISFSLTQPDPFSITDKIIVDVPCHLDNSEMVDYTGYFSFTINGGIPSYNVSIPGIHSSTGRYGNITFTDLPPNTYTVIVDNGFENSVFNIQIGVPSLAMTISEDNTDINCKGEKTGTIVLTVYNNANPISTFDFNYEGATVETLAPNIKRYSSLGAGLYGATVTDSEGCTVKIDNIEICEPELPLTLNSRGSLIREYGDNNGTLEFDIVGGTPGYSYSVYRAGVPITTGTYTGATTIGSLFAGEYSITVTDSKGCIANSGTVNIVQPSAPLALVTTLINNVTCFGGNNGSVTVAASGGWGDYRYRLNQGGYNNTGVFTGLSATEGVDSVYVVDAQGVITGIRIIITQPGEMTISGEKTDINCSGEKTGTIVLTVINNANPISTFDIDYEGATVETLAPNIKRYSSLGAGLYGATVTDSEGCTVKIDNIEICEPELPLTLNSSGSLIRVYGDNNGTLEFEIVGGTPGYSYSVYRAGVQITTGIYTGPTTIGSLFAGKYSVTVADSKGCIANSGTINIVQPSAPLALVTTLINNVTCFGGNNGSVTVEASGGWGDYRYRLNQGGYNNTGVFTGLFPTEGADSIYVVDAQGVTTGIRLIITQPGEMTISGEKTDINCSGEKTGTIVLTVINNANPISTFDFDYEEATVETLAPNIKKYSSLGAGLYGATVTDSEGCTVKIDNIEIIEPKHPLTLNASGSLIRVYGDNNGTLEFDIVGGTPGYSYSVYRAGVQITTGIYTGATTIGSLFAGEYSITVTDSKGCIANSGTVNIVQPSAPLALVTTLINNVTCFGGNNGSVTVEASDGWGDYRYRLNQGGYNNTGVFTGLSATEGVDSVYVVDAQGVITGISLIIAQPGKIAVERVTTYELSCFNNHSGAINLDIVGGTPGYWISTDGVTWMEGDSLGNLDGGSGLTFYIKDSNNCTTTQKASIAEPLELVIISPTKIEDAHCGLQDGSLEVDFYGGTLPYNYNWVNNETSVPLNINSPIISNIKSGSYTLFLTDAHGCTASLTATVNDSDGPTLGLRSIKDVDCYGGHSGEISVNIEGGTPLYDYTFNKLDGTLGGTVSKTGRTTDIATADYLPAGSYLLSVKDLNKCTVYGNFEVTEPKELIVSGEVLDPGCHDSSDGFIALQVTGGTGRHNYLWGDNSTQKNLQFRGEGDYSVRVTDSLGCYTLASFTLIAPPPPVVQLDEIDLTICAGNSMVVDGGEHSAYKWSFNGEELSTDRYLSVSSMGYYVLEGFDEKGCSNKDSVMVMVSSTPLAAFFFLLDSAETGETIEAIDVTWPVPDSIEWHFDHQVTEVGSTYWSNQFTLESPGTINVTLRAWYNGCYSDSTKSVVFISDLEEKVGKNDVEPLILDMKTYPNPTDGNFRLTLELERKSVLLITLYNSVGTVVESRKMEVDGYFELPYSLEGLMPGVYLLVVRGGYEQRQVRIVIR